MHEFVRDTKECIKFVYRSKDDLIILRLRPSMHIATAKVSSYSGFITGIHLLVVLPPSNVGHDLP